MRDDFNICTLTDSYKFGHHWQYLPGTKKVYSYLESRAGAQFDETVFFGLQYILKKYLCGPVVTQAKIDQADERAAIHFGNPNVFNRTMWEHILNVHDGHLPAVIKAVPEGTVVPTGNVMMTIENLDEDCHGLTNHLETILSHVWYASTVCTLSREVKKMLVPFFEESAEEEAMAALDFMLQDFGFRGASSVESAGIGGLAHLVNFQGTDTFRAIEVGMDYYDSGVCGFSVEATEHSVMTSAGPMGEEQVVGHLLDNCHTDILSIVADSYNIYNFCHQILGRTFKAKVLARKGVTVVRPDSGDPVTVMLKCLNILAEEFGCSFNSKGFKVINPKVKLLWGDGLQLEGIYEICMAMLDVGWSIENIACFGMGGGLLQRVHRDIQRFAFKCSAQLRDGEWHDVFKKPAHQTDGSSKGSKRGRLKLIAGDCGLETVPEGSLGQDVMQVVYHSGRLIEDQKFKGIRERAKL